MIIMQAVILLLVLPRAIPQPHSEFQANVLDDQMESAIKKVSHLTQEIDILTAKLNSDRTVFDNASMRLVYSLQTLFPEAAANALLDLTRPPRPDHLSILQVLDGTDSLRSRCASGFAEFFFEYRRCQIRLKVLEKERKAQQELIELAQEFSSDLFSSSGSESGSVSSRSAESL